MNFDLPACRGKILGAVLDQLREQTNYILGIERTKPINALCLDILPWYGHLGMSLRVGRTFRLRHSIDIAPSNGVITTSRATASPRRCVTQLDTFRKSTLDPATTAKLHT
jgi:hypothetical protein